MLTLVTRPEPQASGWAEALAAQGVAAQPLPLIAIEGPPHPEAVARLWHTLAHQRLLMFVSPASAEWFFRLRPQPLQDGSPAPAWPAQTLAAAPGPGTAQAVLALGAAAGLTPDRMVSPPEDSAQFDSEALWPLLAPMAWPDQRVTIVSGGDTSGARGRTWLAAQWQRAGAHVEAVQAYQRGPGAWTSAQQTLARQALAAPQAHVWLFSSSQAIDHLMAHHLPALGHTSARPDWQRMRALCTHPRIAEHAAAQGFGEVRQCAPTVAAVVQARRSAP
ncbi:MAG: uroporphyrinogen-III synthase [Pseudomonadota bacterium]|uniref:uroporphyrinogen-III synthase n=1 Tax=Aquabacterium sp. TaxID=1872578 RepID=UPI001D5E9BDA|nr:uroporphyrinogen-III synthase [Aquabacterium sp.]MBT9609681.1 uroporphyrinogen-III synthase [Aquabacterium sp.]